MIQGHELRGHRVETWRSVRTEPIAEVLVQARLCGEEKVFICVRIACIHLYVYVSYMNKKDESERVRESKVMRYFKISFPGNVRRLFFLSFFVRIEVFE